MTATAPPGANRRQSARQARTSSTRPTNYYARPFGPRGSLQGAPDSRAHNDNAPGFFPALTHFTDAVDALPKEVMRHISMLKEVEAKLAAPNEELKTLCETVERQPPVPRFSIEEYTQSLPNTANNSVSGSVDGGAMQSSTMLYYEKAAEVLNDPAQASQLTQEQLDVHRNILNFVNLQATMARSFVIQALEEKNSVLLTANKTLEKQLARMESSYPYIATEISEEARFGSMTHWAYADKEEKRKTAATSERTRRDVAAANNLAAAAAAVHEGDMAASRSEARREAMMANKRSRQQHVDSDFDDTRPATKKAPTVHRGRKEATDPKVFGLGITNGVNQANKRRKTEKAAAPAMERSISGALKSAAAGGASPRETPGADSVRKRARAAPAPAPGRKRSGLPTAQSPPPASSPLTAAFPAPRDTISAAQRPQSSRIRQNSAANSIHSIAAAETNNTTNNNSRARPSSAASNKPFNGARTLPQDLDPAANRPLPESLAHITTAQDALAADFAARSVPPPSNSTDNHNPNSSTQQNPPLKHEDTDLAPSAPATAPTIESPSEPSSTSMPGATAPAAPPMTTRASAGRASKTATPLTASFPDVPIVRQRSTRNRDRDRDRPGRDASSESTSNVALEAGNVATTATLLSSTGKRSHKKGAGIAATAAAAASATTTAAMATRKHGNSGGNSRGNSRHASSEDDAQAAALSSADAEAEAEAEAADEEDEVDEDGNEPRYCYCNGVSYGDMVACDNEECEREWFHLACVGMTRAPGRNTKWYCDNCRDALRDVLRKGRPGSRH